MTRDVIILILRMNDDMHHEISKYSSKIAMALGQQQVYTTLRQLIYLRFRIQMRFVDVYYDGCFKVIENGQLISIKKLYDMKWHVCHLFYNGSSYYLSHLQSDLQHVLLLLQLMDVPLVTVLEYSNTPQQCDIEWDSKRKEYQLYLVEHYQKHLAIQVQHGHVLYEWLQSHYLTRQTHKYCVTLAILITSFIYIMGLRRLSIYSADTNFVYDAVLAIWVTIIACLKMK